MCAIFGSSSITRLQELFEINRHRGGYSYSIMGFDEYKSMHMLTQVLGEFTTKNLPSSMKYYLAHIQLPTDGIGRTPEIHPAHAGEHYLYHNGMVKLKTGDDLGWDTAWLLDKIISSDGYADALDEIDGSFACVHIRAASRQIKIFTNQTCSLYYSKNNDISSTKFNGSNRFIPCSVYNFETDSVTVESEFDNIDRTYFIRNQNQGGC